MAERNPQITYTVCYLGVSFRNERRADVCCVWVKAFKCVCVRTGLKLECKSLLPLKKISFIDNQTENMTTHLNFPPTPICLHAKGSKCNTRSGLGLAKVNTTHKVILIKSASQSAGMHTAHGRPCKGPTAKMLKCLFKLCSESDHVSNVCNANRLFIEVESCYRPLPGEPVCWVESR